jgi:hypothetical protein
MTSVTFSGSENHNEGSQSAFCSFPMPGESMEAYTARAKAYKDIESVYDRIFKLKRQSKIAFTCLTLGNLATIALAIFALVKLLSL